MIYKVDNNNLNVIIERKNNKNTYLRVKNSSTILITTNYFTSTKNILKLLDNNKEFIMNGINKKQNEEKRQKLFYFLGNEYNVILISTFRNVEISNNKIYTRDLKMLNKWYKNKMIEIFNERLEICYSRYDESIPFPKLKIRNMKTRWGVCNKRDNSVTLNSRLIEYDYDIIDYVIIHELSHFVYFDHSKLFWSLVCKYCPNYKNIRKKLKE